VNYEIFLKAVGARMVGSLAGRERGRKVGARMVGSLAGRERGRVFMKIR